VHCGEVKTEKFNRPSNAMALRGSVHTKRYMPIPCSLLLSELFDVTTAFSATE
jgi:hypothetical protein